METINDIEFNTQVVLTGVAAISVDKFGRKPLILLSGLGTCISIVALGIYFYLDENKNCFSSTEINFIVINIRLIVGRSVTHKKTLLHFVAFSEKLNFSYGFDYLKKLSSKVKMRLLRIFVSISFQFMRPCLAVTADGGARFEVKDY